MKVYIRAAKIEDTFEMARVNVETWQSAYQGIIADSFLQNRSVQSVAERWKKTLWEDRKPGAEAFVAETEEGEIIGIASCGPESNEDPLYKGEIYVLYVLPEYQGQGVGRRLFTACADHLVSELGAGTLLVWVIEANPHRRFYEALGGCAVRQKIETLGGQEVPKVGYGWEGLQGKNRGFEII